MPRAAARALSQTQSSSACHTGRNVFIDLGVNWGNTARLFKNIDPLASEPYHVYGFEASPLIQPFAEEYFAWLAGTRVDEPESCLPRSGSSAHLNMYAPYYGCPAVVPGMANTSAKMLTCMWERLAPQLASLRPEPRLNSSRLIHERIHSARDQCSAAGSFTFIPAAAGDSEAWLEFYSPPHQLIRGGSIPVMDGNEAALRKNQQPGDSRYTFRVRTVDVSAWIKASFSMQDHLILKMDVEGAEFPILDRMWRSHVLPLVDVLSLECHSNIRNCSSLYRKLRRAAPNLTFFDEGKNHSGYDSFSIIHPEEQRRVVQACSSIDPLHFSLSRRQSENAAGERD